MLKEYEKADVNKVIKTQTYVDASILFASFIVTWFFAKSATENQTYLYAALGLLLVTYFVLFCALNMTKRYVKKTLDKVIYDATEKTTGEAKDLESLSLNQKNIFKETFSKLKETQALINNLKNTIISTDKVIKDTKEKTTNSLECTNEEHLAVKANIEKMFVIRHKMQTIAELILELSEFIQSISSTIGLVEDIAEQTNLLALNAAVEAARAGEHGKGFAVVAGEIRKLADESKQATTKITSLINDIQQTTNSTVIATEEGTKEIESGIDLAHNISSSVENLTAIINEISIGMQQIDMESEKINKDTDETGNFVKWVNSSLESANGVIDENYKKFKNLDDINKTLKSAVIE